MSKTKWAIIMITTFLSIYFFQEVLVPTLFPHIYQTPSSWLYAAIFTAAMYIVMNLLVFNLRRESHFH